MNSIEFVKWRWIVISVLLALVITRPYTFIDDAHASSTKQGWAHAYIRFIAKGLDRFHKDTGRWPSTEEGLDVLIRNGSNIQGWQGPYINRDKIPIDRWGHPFVYRFPATSAQRTYDLYSIGPNGRDDGGSKDDIIDLYEK